MGDSKFSRTVTTAEKLQTIRRRELQQRVAEEPYKGNHGAFAKKIGLSRAYISQLLNAQRPINDNVAQRIEEALGLRRGALSGTPKEPEDNLWTFVDPLTQRVKTYRAVPVYKWGTGTMKKREDQWQFQFPLEVAGFVPCGVECSPDTFVYPAPDDTMAPESPRNTHEYWDPRLRKLEEGRMVLLREPTLGNIRRRVLCRDGEGNWFGGVLNNIFDLPMVRVSVDESEHQVVATLVYQGQEPGRFQLPQPRKPQSDEAA